MLMMKSIAQEVAPRDSRKQHLSRRDPHADKQIGMETPEAYANRCMKLIPYNESASPKTLAALQSSSRPTWPTTLPEPTSTSTVA